MIIGVIGAGQLGMMLGESARELGCDCIFLDPNKNSPAKKIGEVLNYEFNDLKAIKKLSSQCDVITYEFENVPVKSINFIDPRKVYPPSDALEITQDRLKEKHLFDSLEIPVAEYSKVDSFSDLLDAADSLGYEFLIKTRSFGYDGKGQFLIKDESDIQKAWDQLGNQPLIAEKKIKFDREISIIGARSLSGEIALYPLTKNNHVNGILRTSRSTEENTIVTKQAHDYLSSLLKKLNYVGVLALELFVKDDKVIANEYAPRVHNSGHWTIEGTEASQFENHVRAIMDMKLGDTSVNGFAGMENLIGCIPAEIKGLSGEFFFHDYGKEERQGRKLGHVSIVTPKEEDREIKLKEIQRIISQT